MLKLIILDVWSLACYTKNTMMSERGEHGEKPKGLEPSEKAPIPTQIKPDSESEKEPEDERAQLLAGVRERAGRPAMTLLDEEKLTEDERSVIEDIMKRREERAVLEHEEDLERRPFERLQRTLGEVAGAMRERGLEGDVQIVDQLMEEVEGMPAQVRGASEAAEEDAARKLSTPRELEKWRRLPRGVLVAAKIGDSGGWVKYPDSREYLSYRDKTAWDEDEIEGPPEGSKYYDQRFSREGSELFYQALGVLEEGQKEIELFDVIAARQDMWEKEKEERRQAGEGVHEDSPVSVRGDHHDFTLEFPTAIEGMRLVVEDDTKSPSGKKGYKLSMEFGDEVLEPEFVQ